MIITVTWRFCANALAIILIAVSLPVAAIVQLRLADGSSVYLWTTEEMMGLDLLLAKMMTERDAAAKDAKKSRECI